MAMRYQAEVCRKARETFRITLAAADARKDQSWAFRAIATEAAMNLQLPAPTWETVQIDAARVLGAWATAAVLRVRAEREAAAAR